MQNVYKTPRQATIIRLLEVLLMAIIIVFITATDSQAQIVDLPNGRRTVQVNKQLIIDAMHNSGQIDFAAVTALGKMDDETVLMTLEVPLPKRRGEKWELIQLEQPSEYFLPQIINNPAEVTKADVFAPNISSASSFEAIDFDGNAANTGYYNIPPDPSGAAGPDHVVVAVNTSIEWYTNAGVQQNSVSLSSFFSSLTPLTGTFDPKVLYDQYAGRFVVITLERTDTAQGDASNTSRIMLAVSDDDNPNGTWYFYEIDSKVTIGSATWADYPGFALDEEAIYISMNMFTFGGVSSYLGQRLWIVEKDAVDGFYYDGTGSFGVYDPWTAVNNAGLASTTQPAHVFGTPADATFGTYLTAYSGLTDGTNEFLGVIEVSDPIGTPSFSLTFVALGDLENTATSVPDSPQSGTGTGVDGGDRRTLQAVWRDNYLWTTGTMVPASGTNSGQATAQWYKVAANPSGTPSLSLKGEIGGEDLAVGAYTSMPAISVDASGNLGIGFAASGSAIYPGSYFTIIPSGTSTAEASDTLKAGIANYVRTFGGGTNRWGDYGGMSLDPDDDSFWMFHQYAKSQGTLLSGENGRWGTTIGNFSFTPLAIVLTSFNASVDADMIRFEWQTERAEEGLQFILQQEVELEGFVDVSSVEGGAGQTTYNSVIAIKNWGEQSFRLKMVDRSGAVSYSNLLKINIQLPSLFRLTSAYPNPFSNNTIISITLAETALAQLELFDIAGRRVRTLFDSIIQKNETQELSLSAAGLAAGVYFYRLQTPFGSETKRLVIAK